MTENKKNFILNLFNFKARFLKSKKHDSEMLFDGDDTQFKYFLSQGRIYGEYGMGASTIWIAKHTENSIISVDTSQSWVSDTQKKLEIEPM